MSQFLSLLGLAKSPHVARLSRLMLLLAGIMMASAQIALAAPVLQITNTGVTLDEGASSMISPTQLTVSDGTNSAAQISYTLTSLPAHGTLALSGATLAIGAGFTQEDIDAGRLVYAHDGSETTTDSFRFRAAAGTPTLTRVSVTSNGTQANNYSHIMALSDDTRYIVFDSDASNLVAGDTNGATDVFVRDAETGTTTRVSVASDGAEGDGPSYTPSISPDGRYVAFQSNASTLVAGDTNDTTDIFIHDLEAGTTTRISVSSDGAQGDDASGGRTAFSADASIVAFQSYATNLVAGDTNHASDIFLRDMRTGTITRVSLADDGTQANGFSSAPALSADGRYVAFHSDATNLVAGDTNGHSDIFVRNMQTGVTTRVSVASDGTQANGSCFSPSLSADGRYVGFDSDASNLVAGDSNATIDVFMHDLQTGTTARISVASDGAEGDNDSLDGTLRADGQAVAFTSWASNLVPGDTNAMGDVFVRDLETGTTTRVSVAADGAQANDDIYGHAIAPDGSVAFSSWASNLVPDDTNNQRDVFLRRMPPSLRSTFPISITPVNDAPTLAAIADVALREDDPAQSIVLSGFSAGPIDEHDQTVTISATSSDPALIPTPTVEYIPGAPTGTLVIRPAPDQSGSATITVTVRDDGGRANGGIDITTRTLVITVAAVNDAPDFTPGVDQIVAPDAGAQKVIGWVRTFQPGPIDEAGQAVLEYRVVGNTQPALFAVAPAIAADGTLTYTPKAGAAGQATISVVARDNGGTAYGGVDTSPVRTFRITVGRTYQLVLPLVQG